MGDVRVVEQEIAVNKPGQLRSGAGVVDCDVVNLTRRGAKLRLQRKLALKGPLFLSLGDVSQLACKVEKRSGDLVDVAFQGDAERLDALFQDVLARMGDEEGRRRYLRRSVLWPGTLTCGKHQHACTILNMSLGGAKIALSEQRDCAGVVTLLGDRFESLSATVVWQRGRLVGLQFRREPAEVARVLGDLLPAIKASA